MSDFPTLVPNSITYDHGRANVSEYSIFGAGPVRFRHSNYINGQNVQLVYRALAQAQVQLIRDHYQIVGGTHGSFNAPLAIWGGASAAAVDSKYRYAETPTEEHTGLHYNVTVSLRLLEGVFISLNLDGGPATLPAESAFSKYVFDGTAPFILNGTDTATATLKLNATQTN